MWLNWTDIVLGLALIIVSFMDLTGQVLFWTLAGIGLLFVVAGFAAMNQFGKIQAKTL